MPDTNPTPGPKPDQPDRLEGQSLDLLGQRLAAIKTLLPEAFDLDGNLVRDKLIEALKPATYEDTDDIPSFGLAWPGKQRAFAAAGVPTTATLRPCPEQSIDFDTTQNLLIEGDNLEVLKTLQRGYHGKVKMIYIDPPYNTGKDFVYPDNYGEGLDTYLQRTQQKDEDGFWKSTNSETSGRKHANWLSMMTPRLTLSRNLLHDAGVIFISIDDNEVANLRMLCDEVFGPENFYGCFVWRRRSGSMDSTDNVSTDHEYVLCYGRKKHKLNGNARTFDRYQNPDGDMRGPWIADNLTAGKPGGDTYYPIEDPDTGNIFYPPKGRYWPYSRNTMAQKIQEGRVIFPSTPDGAPLLKRFQNEAKSTVVPVSTLGTPRSADHSDNAFITAPNTHGTNEIKELFGDKLFTFPKPTQLIHSLLDQASTSTGNDIVLDFFAGSGTTGQAVMAQNAKDGGNRRYICVQLPEPLDDAVTLDDGVVCETIFDLTRERLKRAGKKIKEEAGLNADKLDTGLRVFKLASSNFTAWNSEPTSEQGELYDRLEQLTEQTVPGRSETDILWEVLLKMGLPLDLQLERFEIEGATFIGVNDRTRVMSTETAIPTAAMEALLDPPEGHIPPSELVVLDSAFEDDTARANIATLYKERKDEDGRPVCNLRVV